MATEAEMMADLQAADAAGDTALAQHIAGLIKQARAAPAPAKKEPGGMLRWVQKVGEGAIPGYNRLVALGSAATDPLFGLDSGPTFGKRYENRLRQAQQQSAKTQSEHPWVSSFVQGLAAAPTALAFPAPAMAAHAPLLTRMAQGVAAAAPIGAAYAAGDAPADASATDVLGRTAIGAGAAGALGAAAPVVSEVAAPVGRFLRGKSLEYGQKALTGNTGKIGVSKTPSDAAVEAAYDTGAIRPFAGIKGISQRLDATREAMGAEKAAIVAALEQAGVKGPDPVVVEQILRTKGSDAFRNTGMGKIRSIYNEAADSIAEIGAMQNRSLGLQQTENIKGAHQREAKYNRVQADTNAMGARKEVASVLRQATEDAINQQASVAPDLAAQFEPIKQKLGPIIEASDLADIAAARAAARQKHGLASQVMAAGELASGNPLSAAGALYGTSFLKNRGPATFGSLARYGSNLLTSPLAPAVTSAGARSAAPTEAEAFAQMLMDAMAQRRLRMTGAAAGEEER